MTKSYGLVGRTRPLDPFSISELAVKVQTVLRRPRRTQSSGGQSLKPLAGGADRPDALGRGADSDAGTPQT